MLPVQFLIRAAKTATQVMRLNQEEWRGTMDIPVAYSVRMTIPFISDGDVDESVGYTGSSNDRKLVLAARSGCQTAFNKLWELYSRRVYRTILGITNNAQDAEDALQDSFFRAFLALDSFEGRASFYSWLTRIAINSAFGILRKRRSQPETYLNTTSQQEDESAPEEFRDLAPDPEQAYAEYQRHAKLMQAIGLLPTSLREAIQTQITEDCSLREVADRLNISEVAAKSRLYRARKLLGSLTTAPLRAKTQAAASDAKVSVNTIVQLHRLATSGLIEAKFGSEANS
jgi:RNA polymerase sigma-70 factor, ECF subfamily